MLASFPDISNRVDDQRERKSKREAAAAAGVFIASQPAMACM